MIQNGTGIEMNKIKCVYNSPILIGSVILQNSKVSLFDYMYNKFPKLFGKENMKIGYVDTDSIIFKIENMKNKEYQNIQKKIILTYSDAKLVLWKMK